MSRKGRDSFEDYEEEYDDSVQRQGSRQKKGARGQPKPRKKQRKREETFFADQETIEKRVEEGDFWARVVEVHKRYSFVSPIKGQVGDEIDIDTKDVWIATVARRHLQDTRVERNFVCVGDIVLCRPAAPEEEISEELPHCSIENGLDRVNQIQRIDPQISERRHVIASNIDQLVVVSSYLNPTVKWGLIDRYLVLAELERITATIVLNKKDLLQASGKEKLVGECRNAEEVYRSLGYRVACFQAESRASMGEASMSELQDIFSGKVSLVSGHSGVGKSSLINLLGPEIEQDVETDGIFYKGRHTTTYASLIRLEKGGYVVDTPGVRSFAIEERGSIDLAWCFREMREVARLCKFRACRHVDEPGCEVREAVRRGEIDERRYKSYLAILTGATAREGRLGSINL